MVSESLGRLVSCSVENGHDGVGREKLLLRVRAARVVLHGGGGHGAVEALYKKSALGAGIWRRWIATRIILLHW